MLIARTLSDRCRAILRDDIATISASATDPRYILAPWRTYYRAAKHAHGKALAQPFGKYRAELVADAAVCLALAIAARRQSRRSAK